MTDEAVITSAWPEWSVVELIGEGACGAVYHVRRRDLPDISAAVKLIPVPAQDGDLYALRSQGFSEDETAAFVDRLAEDWKNELLMMKKYQGMSHFVSIEDGKILPRTEGGPGKWILIRMEKLKSLNTYMDGKTLSEPEVLELGLQLCQALAVCHADGLIHRDIKPENIFVNDRLASGVLFKLGDFGASRPMENAGSLTIRGAPAYMAPEIVQGKPYDQRVDIYSLGMTLYRLMNGNRLPFLPARQLFTHEDYAVALRSRLNGMPLPDAADASPALNRVLAKACAFRPEDRFSSAEEFSRALTAVQSGKRPRGLSSPRKRVWLWAALAALLLTGAALLLRQAIFPALRTAPQPTPRPMLTVTDLRTGPR